MSRIQYTYLIGTVLIVLSYLPPLTDKVAMRLWSGGLFCYVVASIKEPRQ